MNNRQKAKHFKRLYEESLPKKPYPVVYQYVDNFQLFRVKQCIAFDDIVYVQDPNLVKTCIENRILQEIRPLIFDRLNVKKDPYTEGYIYSLDLYLRRETDVDAMEGCHSCLYGKEFDTEKEPCKYCYGLSLYTKKEINK